MFYLLLATICSATIALIFKYTEGNDTNRYLITSSNYFIAFTTSIFMAFYKGLFTGLTKEGSFINEFKFLLTQDSYILSPYSSVIWGAIVGSLSGAFFFLSFIYYQKSVKENGVGISGCFAKLGILIPMIFSILIWKEFPSTVQWIGILLSLVSILIVNLSPKSLEKFDLKPTIILLFLFGGLAEFSSKIYQQYGLNEYKDIFLFFIFFVAFLISIFFTLRQKSKFTIRDILTGFSVGIPNLFSSYFLILSLDSLQTSVAFPLYSAGSILLINIVAFLISIFFTLRQKSKFTIRDILTGFAVGIPNLFSSYFLILSLDSLQTSVAFPLYSAGSILLINIGGFVIFKEKISNKNKFAIGLIMVALVLINIK